MRIYNSITELVGNTPLVALNGFSKQHNLHHPLLAKVEFFNPAGSVKDRVALHIIEDAEQKGMLTPDSVIIEPTSGNTGIGLAAIAAVKGYKVILTMPDTMSVERVMLLKAYGAQIIKTEGRLGMVGATQKAEELAKATPNSFLAGQFFNPANPAAHRAATGPEIWGDTDGAVDVFVAGVGTGGTVTGVGSFLKEKKPGLHVIAVEPSASPLLSKGQAGPHGLQGIGANFVPDVLDRAVYDEIVTVSETDAYQAAHDIAKLDGLLVGISSGAAAYAAAVVANRAAYQEKMIVVLLPDTGERYLSTRLFDAFR